jgi:integrase
VVLTPKENSPLKGEENKPYVATVSSDIYNWSKRYASAIRRIKQDANISPSNRATVISFLESRDARGLSVARVVKYANHLIVVARLCPRNFDAMDADDVRHVLLRLKNREKENKGWVLSDTKSMLKVFWRWMKGMDESKAIYPPEVNWFTEGRYKSVTVNRSDLLTEQEVDMLASATNDAQDAALIKVLNDAGGRISEILTLRIRDAEPRPYGFKLNVWTSKAYTHPIPIAKSAPALSRWLSLHPLRGIPDAPLWLNERREQLLYGAARMKMRRIIDRLEMKGGRKFGKRVWFHLFRHTSATEFMKKRKGAPAVMNKKYGWSAGSDMWSVYAHMVDEDVEEAVARADADEQQAMEFRVTEETKRPRKCDRCESVNDPSARFCSRCAFPLDEEVAREAFEAEEKKGEAEELLSKVMKDARVREVIFQVLSEASVKEVSQEITSRAGRREWR